MSEYNYDSEKEIYSFTINEEKLRQFQQWCDTNKIDNQNFFTEIIDICLVDDEKIKSLLLSENNQVNLEKKIQFYLYKSLQPLINRIEQLEIQINRSSKTISSATIASKSITETKDNVENIDFDETKITYIPRNEVWRRLKQTSTPHRK